MIESQTKLRCGVKSLRGKLHETSGKPLSVGVSIHQMLVSSSSASIPKYQNHLDGVIVYMIFRTSEYLIGVALSTVHEAIQALTAVGMVESRFWVFI